MQGSEARGWVRQSVTQESLPQTQTVVTGRWVLAGRYVSGGVHGSSHAAQRLTEGPPGGARRRGGPPPRPPWRRRPSLQRRRSGRTSGRSIHPGRGRRSCRRRRCAAPAAGGPGGGSRGLCSVVQASGRSSRCQAAHEGACAHIHTSLASSHPTRRPSTHQAGDAVGCGQVIAQRLHCSVSAQLAAPAGGAAVASLLHIRAGAAPVRSGLRGGVGRGGRGWVAGQCCTQPPKRAGSRAAIRAPCHR